MTAEAIAALVVAIGALLTALAALSKSRSENQKNYSDATAITVNASAAVINELQEENGRLRNRINELEDHYQAKVREIEQQLAEQERHYQVKIQVLENKFQAQYEKLLRLEVNLSQAYERITALETENELLQEGGDQCQKNS